jgi:hypothetical protein
MRDREMSTSGIHGAGWVRDKPRPRHGVSARRIQLLKMLGFRYSGSRDAYVLRLVGNRYGPVYQLRHRKP